MPTASRPCFRARCTKRANRPGSEWIFLFFGLIIILQQSVIHTHSTKLCNSGKEFTCIGNQTICVPLSRLKDGYPDCPDASDENCFSGEFRCRTGYQCIPLQRVRDGIKDCKDGSDEESRSRNNFVSFDENHSDRLEVRQTDPREKNQYFEGNLRNIDRPTGLLHLRTSSSIHDGTTTLYTTELHRSYINGNYAEIILSHSTLIYPASSRNTILETSISPRVTSSTKRYHSLTSGGIYQTALNDLTSHSQYVLPDGINSNNSIATVYGSYIETIATLENSNIRATPASLYTSQSAIQITGSYIPLQRRNSVLHIGKTDGSIATLFHHKSIITVTGTEGAFVHQGKLGETTYTVFTGTYTDGLVQPTTYMFFFGNRRLPSTIEATSAHPYKYTTHTYDVKNKKNLNKEIVLDISDDIDVFIPLGANNRRGFDRSTSRRSLMYGKAQVHGQSVDGVLIEGSEKFSVQGATPALGLGYVSTMTVTIDQIKPSPSYNEFHVHPDSHQLLKTYRVVNGEFLPENTLPSDINMENNRRGRMFDFQPTGRKINAPRGSTLITDQFILPQRVQKTTTITETKTITTSKNQIKYSYEMKPSYVVKDNRPTRTIKPYSLLKETEQHNIFQPVFVSSTSNQRRVGIVRSTLLPSRASSLSTVTLFGFVHFTTIISSTKFIFMPTTSSAQGRSAYPLSITHIPIALKTSRNPEFLSKSSSFSQSTPVLAYGTDTREFVSKKTMSTSTIKDTIKHMTTMSTLTIGTNLRTRYGKANIKPSYITEVYQPTYSTVFLKETQTEKSPSQKDIDESQTPSIKDDNDFEDAHDISKIFDETIMVFEVDEKKTVKETSTKTPPTSLVYPTGLVSSITGTEELNGITTHWTTLIIGTYISGTYAHIVESTSSIFFTVSKTTMPIEPTKVTEAVLGRSAGDEDIWSASHNYIEASVDDFLIQSSKVELEQDTLETPIDSMTQSQFLEIITSAFILPESSTVIEPIVSYSVIKEASNVLKDEMITTEDMEITTEDTPIKEVTLEEIENAVTTPQTDTTTHETDNSENTEISTETSTSTTPKIITGGFILPGIDITTGKEITDTEEITTEPNQNGINNLSENITETPHIPNILTEGFFLPVAENISSTSLEKTDLNKTSTNKSSVITSGFILPINIKDIIKSPDIITQGFILPKVFNTIHENENSTTKPEISSTIESSIKETTTSITNGNVITEKFIFPSESEITTEDSTKETVSSTTNTGVITEKFILPAKPKLTTKVSEEETISSTTDTDVITEKFILSAKPKLTTKVSAEETISSTTDTDVITEKFILPAKPKHTTKVTEEETTTLTTTTDIITEKFILPVQTEIKESDVNSEISKYKKENTSTDSVPQILTAGFILPNIKSVNEESSTSSTSSPAPILLTGNFFLPESTFSKSSEFAITENYKNETKIEAEPKHSNSEASNETSISTGIITESFILPNADLSAKNQETEKIEHQKLITAGFILPGVFPLTTDAKSTTNEWREIENTTSRVGKTLTLNESLNKSDDNVEELIKAISYPITYYTTLTYFTTYLHDNKTVISSREDVFSQVYNNSEEHKLAEVSKTSLPIMPTSTKEYETRTHYSTSYTEGFPIVTSSEETVPVIVTGTPELPTEALQPSFSIQTYPTTYYTTLTYFETVVQEDSTSVITKEKILSSVITPKVEDTIKPIKSSETLEITSLVKLTSEIESSKAEENSELFDISSSIATKTLQLSLSTSKETESISGSNNNYIDSIKDISTNLYTTLTHFITLLRGGSTIVSTRKETISNGIVKSLTSSVTIPEMISPTSTTPPSLKTVYTTLTYFTTFLRNGSEIVSSRKSTITSILDSIESKPITPTLAYRTTLYTTLTSLITNLKGDATSVNTVLQTITNVINNIHSTPVIQPSAVTKTYYTTYTYLTTFLHNGTPTVSSRKETSTNIITESAKNEIKDIKTVQSIPKQTEITSYTTFTYYTTFLVNGEPSISTHKETVSNIVTPTLPKATAVVQDEVTKFQSNLPNSIDLKEILKSALVTRYTTFTYYTTLFTDGNTIVSSRTEVVTNVATASIKTQDSSTVIASKIALPSVIPSSSKVIELKTYYTTLTYYTTYLQGDKSVVTSNIGTVSNVVTSTRAKRDLSTKFKIKPTKVIPLISSVKSKESKPQKRKLLHVREEENNPVDLYEEESYSDLSAISNDDLVYPYVKGNGGLVARSIADEDAKKAGFAINPTTTNGQPYPTGLIQSVEAKTINNGVTTVFATEVYGTFINGAYAQVVQSAVRIYSDPPNEIDRSQAASTIDSYNFQSTAQPTPTLPSYKVGLVSSITNSRVNDGTTTHYTTNIYGTYVKGVYAHIAQTTSSVQRIKATPSSYATGLISTSLRSAINDGTTTVWTTKIFGTFLNGFYAHVASTYSNVITPTKAQWFEATPDYGIHSSLKSSDSISQNVVSQTPSLSNYKTGFISSQVSDLVHNDVTTRYITSIFGTHIGGIYAQIAKTTSTILLVKPTNTQTTHSRNTGLVSSQVSTLINGNTATYFITEIYGTYLGTLYAQVARTSTETKVLSPTTSTEPTTRKTYKTGLVSSTVVSSEVHDSTTTLYLSEIYGTYIGNVYAHIAKSTSRIVTSTPALQPRSQAAISWTEQSLSSTTPSQKIGIVSSTVYSSEVNSGTTTLHVSEVHGTYIGGFYAHVARRTSTVLPVITTTSEITSQSPSPTKTNTNTEGLISSEVNTEINHQTTTLHTKLIYGTYINGFYAHIARSTSTIIKPTSTNGLISSVINTEINDGITTLHTTDIYGTHINGFYAHVARSSSTVLKNSASNIIETTDSQDNQIVSTPVRYNYETLKELQPSDVAISPTVALTVINNELDGAADNKVDGNITTPPKVEDPLKHHEKSITMSTPYKIKLSPSINSENFLELTDKLTPTLNPSEDTDFIIKSEAVVTTISKSSKESLKEVTDIIQKSSSSIIPTDIIQKSSTSIIPLKSSKPEKINNSVSDDLDYEDYYDFENEDTVSKFTKSSEKSLQSTLSPTTFSSQTSSSSVTKSEKTIDHSDYEDYEDYYDEYSESKKETKQSTPTIQPTSTKKNRPARAGQTNRPQQYIRNTKSIANDKEYDDYDEYDNRYKTSTPVSKHEEFTTSKEVSPVVKIRPFRTRDRPVFTIPSRTTTSKPSFTIHFRRPTRTRSFQRFGQKSDNLEDDEHKESDNHGDIDASEAIVSSAPPQIAPVRRFKPTNSRFVPNRPSRNQSFLGRNRRPFTGRSSVPSPTPAQRDEEQDHSDYEENTTEEEDYNEYGEQNEKSENRYNRPRSTRRPVFPRRTRTYGDRRSSSFLNRARSKEEEDSENDNIEASTPEYNRFRYNRNNRYKNRRGGSRSPTLKSSFNSVNREEDEDSDVRSSISFSRHRSNNRRRPYNPRTNRQTLSTSKSTNTWTKPPVTVTSVVTTVKTLPIYHGFKTSYATLTTTTLDTSIIHPSQYSTIITDGLTKTLFYSKVGIPDVNGPLDQLQTTITEIIITTTSLASVKLVPIKIGFSTRTDTITDVQVLTTLSTVYSTIAPETSTPTAFPQYPVPFFPGQNGGGGGAAGGGGDINLLTNSFVTTQTIISTTVIPIILRGRTIMSTLTTTSTSESTVIKTTTVRVPAQVPSPAPFIPQQYFAFQPLTTLLTLYVTGDKGELKPVVTTVTVPFYQQPLFHTKVARSLQSRTSDYSPITHTQLAKFPLQTSREIEFDTQQDMLLSSGLEEINDVIEMTTTISTEPLDSSKLLDSSSSDVKTIFKGSITEIYERSATVDFISSASQEKDDNPYGNGLRYNFRRLQQFEDNRDQGGFRPVRDFTRIRRPTVPRLTTQYSPPSRNIPLPKPTEDQLDDPFDDEEEQKTIPENLPQHLPQIAAAPEEGNQPKYEIPTLPDRVLEPVKLNEGRIINGNAPRRKYKVIRLGSSNRPGAAVRRKIVTKSISSPIVTETFKIENTLQPLIANTVAEKITEGTEATAEENVHNIITEPTYSKAEPLPSRRKIIRRIRPTKGIGSGRPLIIRRTKVNSVANDRNHLSTSVAPSPIEITDEKKLTTPPRRKIIRLRKPTQPGVNGRRRIIVTKTLTGNKNTGTLQGRGPIGVKNQQDDFFENTKLLQPPGSDPSIQLGKYVTQLIPLTYFTTLTYYTTVLHGTDIDYSSSESVHSNVIPQTIDSNLVRVVQTQRGYTVLPGGNSIVHLGSRTLDGSTTVVNLASRVRIFNTDVYKGVFEPADTIHSTVAPEPQQTVAIDRLAQLPKTYYTHFTYFYTFYDGLNTRMSVRAETVTRVATEPASITENHGNTIDSQGFLALLPESMTTNLGLRSIAGTTTEVNLALQTLIHFDGISNAYVKEATVAHEISLQPTLDTSYEVSELSHLQPSYSSVNELIGTSSLEIPTPEIPTETLPQQPSPTIKRKVVLTSVLQKASGKFRQGIFTPRPGVRVVVRPRSSKQKLLTPSISDTSDFPDSTQISLIPPGFETSTNEVIDTASIQSSRESLESDVPISTESIEENISETTTEDREQTETSQLTRKRLKITITRPHHQTGKVRTHSRFVLPSRFEITSRPSFYVVTRTGVSGVVKATRKPFTVKIGRRKSKTELFKPSPSTTVIYETYTTLTSVPVIFGLETSYRNVLLTASSAVTLSQLSPNYELQTPNIGSTHTVVLTYFTTTTFTIPFTIGGQTLFTTLEETNSRILTQTLEIPATFTSSIIKPTTTSTSDLYIPTIQTLIPQPQPSFTTSTQDAVTSIEFGIGGPTTHLVLSGKDGSSTRSIFYPLLSGAIPGTKVIIVGADGISLTSQYGYVPEESTITSPITTIPTVSSYSEPSVSSTIPETTVFTTTSPQFSTTYDIKTYFTTYTFFTTFFSGTDSIISSTEQVLTNVVTVPIFKQILSTSDTSSSSTESVTEILPSTVLETSERVITSTSFSTNTFYATLFSDTSSFVTPIEEISSELFTITETYTITRIISPTSTAVSTSTIAPITTVASTIPTAETTSVIVTSTFYTTYTNFITLFKDTGSVVSTMEDIVSNVVTLTLPKTVITAIAPTTTSSTQLSTTSEITATTTTIPISSSPTSSSSSESSEIASTTHLYSYTITRTSLNTQTHYITLFNGDQTSLSSIEEVHTQLITETIPLTIPSSSSTSTSTETITTYTPTSTTQILFTSVTIPTRLTTTTETSSSPVHEVPLVPSVRAMLTTYTYYTTLFSGTSPIVASQEEVATSYVTFFVPDTAVPKSVSSSVITPTSTVVYITTTDYSTFTFYTTFFSDDKPVVVSNTQVVPEIVVSTVTTSKMITAPSPSVQSVIAFLSTHTYYTTYFSGTNVLVTSSESVITQYVTIESTVQSTPTSSIIIPTKSSTESVIDVSSVIHTAVSVGSHVEEIVNVVTAVSTATEPLPDTIHTETIIEVATEIPESSVRVETNVAVSTRIDSQIDQDKVIDSTVIVVIDGTSTSIQEGTPVLTDTSTIIHEEIPVIISSPSISIQEQVSTVVIEPTPITSEIPQSSSILTEIINGSTIIVYQDFGLSSFVPTETIHTDIETVTLPTTPRKANISEQIDLEDTTKSETTTITSSDEVTEITKGETETTDQTTPQPETKPGLVFELSDLLGGNTSLGGNIGDAIKDILSQITGKKNDTPVADISAVKTEKSESTAVQKSTISLPTVIFPFSSIGTNVSSNTSISKPSETLMPVYKPPSAIETTIVSSIATKAIETGIQTVLLQSSFSSVNTTVSSKPTSAVTLISSKTFVLPTVLSPIHISTKSSVANVTSISVTTNIHSGIKTIFFIPKEPTITVKKETTVTTDTAIKTNTTDITKLKTSSVIEIASTPVISSTSIKTSTIIDSSSIMLPSIELESSFTDTTPVSSATIAIPVNHTVKTSVVTGIKTIFFAPPGAPGRIEPVKTSTETTKPTVITTDEQPSKSEDKLQDSFTISSSEGQTILGKTKTGATTIFFPTSQSSQPTPSLSESTKYITSIEAFIRTNVITTTKIYYTGDSSIHVTSVITSTYPPRTFVTTIIGTRTLLGIVTQKSEIPIITVPNQTFTQQIGFSLTHGVQTLTASTTEVSTQNTVITEISTERTETKTDVLDNLVKDAKPDRNPRLKTDDRLLTDRPVYPGTTTKTPSVVWRKNTEVTCKPKCNADNKETCHIVNGRGQCQCKPGFAKKDGKAICEEIQTYVVLLRVVRRGERAVKFNQELSNNQSDKYKEFVSAAKAGINNAYKGTRVGEELISADVNGILPSAELRNNNNKEGVVVNFTIQVSRDSYLNPSVLQEELARSLLQSNYSIGGTELYVSRLIQSVEDVQVADFDECENEENNDCGSGSICINRPGSYVCQCKTGFEDMDPEHPGRVCLGEIKSCERCNGRGDCVGTLDGGQICRCHSLYIGKKCEVNGLILAIAIPIAGAIVFFAVCCAFCCCKKRRRMPKDNSNVVFRGIALRGPLTGTIDRKAIIPPDTSSESSGEHHSKKHGYDGFIETSDLTTKKSSKRSDLSLDRSLSTGYAMPAVAIPRAKSQHPPGHPKKVNYTVYRGQVYVW